MGGDREEERENRSVGARESVRVRGDRKTLGVYFAAPFTCSFACPFATPCFAAYSVPALKNGSKMDKMWIDDAVGL